MGPFSINRDIHQNLEREELLVLRALEVGLLFITLYLVVANFACTAMWKE